MPENIRFENHTVVITGAGHGLGRGYALHLAKRGSRIVVNDIDENAGMAVVDSIVREGGKATFCNHNVTDYDETEKIINCALTEYGHIDCIIANAGILRDKSFSNMDIRDFETVMQVHLLGTTYITHHAWPHMRRQNHGRLIFTSSSSGLWGNYGQTNYNAAKLGIVGLMQALRIEGERHNIQINTIAPYAMSRLGKGIFPEALEKEMSTEQVSALIVYLCSKECALNGEIIELGAGRMTRARIQRTDGVVFNNIPTPEDIRNILPTFLDQPFDKSFSTALESFADHMKHQDY